MPVMRRGASARGIQPLDRAVAPRLGDAGGEGERPPVGRPVELADAERGIRRLHRLAAAGVDDEDLRLALRVAAQERDARSVGRQPRRASAVPR